MSAPILTPGHPFKTVSENCADYREAWRVYQMAESINDWPGMHNIGKRLDELARTFWAGVTYGENR